MLDIKIGLEFRQVEQKLLAKLLPDTQVPQWHYRCRSYDMEQPTKGFPQMVPFNPRVGTNLTEKWQWFLLNQQLYYMFGLANFDQLDVDFKFNWRLLNSDQKERITRWFNSMFDDHRFLTNDKGVNNCRNYITGERLNSDYPKAWEVACAVNTVELVSDRVIDTQGSLWYEIKTLNGSQNPPSLREVNYITTPQYIHTAVTWQFNGSFTTGDFPQVYNAFGFSKHSLYPIVSPEGKVLVETNRVLTLPYGQIYTNPFEI
jgi:hypothetical protein